MRTPTTLPVASVGAGFLLLLGAAACSSFTTSPSSADSSDAASVDATVSPVVDGGETPPTATDAGASDPAVLAAAIDPSRVNSCAAWAEDAHSANFTVVDAKGTDPAACRLCRKGDGPPYVRLSLPTLPGTYTITAEARQFGTARLTWGVGFAAAGTAVSVSGGMAAPNYAYLSRTSSTPIDTSLPTYATLEIDNATSDGQCVDIAMITIAHAAH